VRVPNDGHVVVSLPLDSSKTGVAFTHLLTYETHGDDDFNFQIQKSHTQDEFLFEATTWNGRGKRSAIEFDATTLEWPACLPAYVKVVRMSTAPSPTGMALVVHDLPIPLPSEQYFVINEFLTYRPNNDDDMAWSLYFEPLDQHVSFQLATANAKGNNDYVEAEAAIVQFPVALGLPKAVSIPSAAAVQNTPNDGATIHLSGALSRANRIRDITPDTIVSYSWSENGDTIATGVEVDIEFAPGMHHVTLTVVDECGFSDQAEVFVAVSVENPRHPMEKDEGED